MHFANVLEVITEPFSIRNYHEMLSSLLLVGLLLLMMLHLICSLLRAQGDYCTFEGLPLCVPLPFVTIVS